MENNDKLTQNDIIKKRVALSKENYKKIKIASEILDINGKEQFLIDSVINKAIELLFEEKVLPVITKL